MDEKVEKEEKAEKREEERGSLRYSSEVSAEELRKAEEYLSSYRHGVRMLDCM